MKLDEKVLKPVATVYSNTIQQPVRPGVANFFNNAADAWSAVDDFLQGKVHAGLHDVMRVGTNTLFARWRILDPASEMGFEHTYEDFGQTWASGASVRAPYVVSPCSTSTVRESFAAACRSLGLAGGIITTAVPWPRRRAADHQHPGQPAGREPYG